MKKAALNLLKAVRALLCMLFFPMYVSNAIAAVLSEPVIIDHRHTDIAVIPEAAIAQAKNNLHIAYGHTSHGSQLTVGMSGLVDFANGGGLGLSHPSDIFAWNNGGSGGALDLHDYAMGGDVGYWPDWRDNTISYLSANPDVNVVIWSWCGQVETKYAAGTLYSQYLTPMSLLEQAYPNVTFVYMTGHVEISEDQANKAANQIIRDYAVANNKVLYDFADIERYDPDGNYYEYADDNCNYYSAGGSLLGNWATAWQSTHDMGVDWYDCGAAHSESLNANRKAYAAWYLWARLGGWQPGNPTAGATVTESGGATTVAEGGRSDSYQLILNSQPSSEVMITVTPDQQLDLGDGVGVSIQLSFSPESWSVAQIVAVSAADDTLPECGHSGRIKHLAVSADEDYDGIDLGDVAVAITDNDKQNCLLLNIIPVIANRNAETR